MSMVENKKGQEKRRVKEYVKALENLNKDIAQANDYLKDLRTDLNTLVATAIVSPFTDLKLIQTRDRVNELVDNLNEIFYLLAKGR